jgi:FMN phosphatase YigB (HAD superfamily)
VVTNGPLFSQEPKIARVEMDKYVDHIILGGSLQYEKPHPSIFQLACRKARCEPSEAMHVGDSLDSDIKGANTCGITSVWLNPGEYVAQPVPTPDYIIRHICELEDVLNGLV